jgi:lambda family phage portal protein
LKWVDRVINVFSPEAAYKREQWRRASSYDAGDSGRLNSGWTAVNSTGEQANQAQREIIRARARDLERNSDIAEAIISSFERNVTGTGIIPQAKVKTEKGEDDEALNASIEELWSEWKKKKNCDVSSDVGFEEMQELIIRRLIVDGGIVAIKVYDNEGFIPFSLQIKEVDDLDLSLNQTISQQGTRIIGGIEINKYNKPIAYYFRNYTVDGMWDGTTQKIEADRVIYLRKKQRFSQIREVSRLSKTLPRIRDINEFVEALSVKERILACLSVFITKQTPTGMGRGVKDDKSGYKKATISPGMIHELQPGESINAVNPSGQSSNAKDFINTEQRLAASGQGLSYEAASRDMSQVNYSSARQGLLEDQKTYLMWQQFIINNFCQEVYEEFVQACVLSGKLKIKDFFQNKSKYVKCQWIPPGWTWIDPLKEVKANEIALVTGQDTLANLCAQRGYDWKEVVKQRAKEIQFAKDLGINIGGESVGQEQIAVQGEAEGTKSDKNVKS